ncbi:hypothetical protein B0H66DRAFT_606601 [Apodospora peruviana]|uniref:Uncharacterized protein n=1 Tax=Apodospora peruviana TaxID=516989 RepID=A0AAE0HUV9_9PEZI|nr:hypothetical protein B0H66DRAFT_606601 [Apodospora peruviana]
MAEHNARVMSLLGNLTHDIVLLKDNIATLKADTIKTTRVQSSSSPSRPWPPNSSPSPFRSSNLRPPSRHRAKSQPQPWSWRPSPLPLAPLPTLASAFHDVLPGPGLFLVPTQGLLDSVTPATTLLDVPPGPVPITTLRSVMIAGPPKGRPWPRPAGTPLPKPSSAKSRKSNTTTTITMPTPTLTPTISKASSPSLTKTGP